MSLTPEEATARAEAEVRAYCGWHVAPSRTETLTLDGSGSSVLLLPSLHVTELVSVTEDGDLVDPDHYEWSGSGVVRRTHSTSWWSYGGYWTAKLRGVVVSLVHGYATVPVDMQTVIDRVASRAEELAGASQILSQVGGVRYAVGVEGLRNTGLLSEADLFVLDRYRLPVLP